MIFIQNKYLWYHRIGSQLSYSVPWAWEIVFSLDFGAFIILTFLISFILKQKPHCWFNLVLFPIWSTHILDFQGWQTHQLVKPNPWSFPLISKFDHLLLPQLLWNSVCRHSHHSCPCKNFQAIVIQKARLSSSFHSVKHLLPIHPWGTEPYETPSTYLIFFHCQALLWNRMFFYNVFLRADIVRSVVFFFT